MFVETNWVVAYAAPAHMQVPAAHQLLEEARSGNLVLHLPAFCLTEARHPLRTKFQPRVAADALRKYLGWATRQGEIERDSAEMIRSALNRYEARIVDELDHLDERLQKLTKQSGLEVFALTDTMLERAIRLSTMHLDLKPFDQAVLAAVLVTAERLRGEGADELAFCELDSDLQPWDKNGGPKQLLADLYDSAGVWVYGDFAMQSPPRRPAFPG